MKVNWHIPIRSRLYLYHTDEIVGLCYIVLLSHHVIESHSTKIRMTLVLMNWRQQTKPIYVYYIYKLI